MKNRLIAAAALSAASGTVQAQSSVTVYGIVDAAVRKVHNNSGSMWSMVSGSLNASRIGFKGSEDLGGGFSANFVLESDLFTDNGTAGGNTTTPVPANQFWSRIATVGLKSRTWGEVRLGRDYTPAFLTVVAYDPFANVGVGSIANLFSSTQVAAVFGAFGPNTTSYNDLVRTSNSVSYYTPATLGGFFASAQGALSEGAATAGASGNTKFWSVRAGYASGPVTLDAAYADTRNTNIAGRSFNEAAVGGSYDFGVVKLMAEYAQVKYVGAKSGVVLLSAVGSLGLGTWKLSYGRVDQSGTAPVAMGATRAGASIGDRDMSQIAGGYAYHLSKRSAVYTQVARIMNKGANAAFSISGGPAFAAGADRKSTAYEVGIRHFF